MILPWLQLSRYVLAPAYISERMMLHCELSCANMRRNSPCGKAPPASKTGSMLEGICNLSWNSPKVWHSPFLAHDSAMSLCGATTTASHRLYFQISARLSPGGTEGPMVKHGPNTSAQTQTR